MSASVVRCGVVGPCPRRAPDGAWVDMVGGCGNPITEAAHALIWPEDVDWTLWHAECCPAPHPHVWIPRPTVVRLNVPEFRRLAARRLLRVVA